jgi:hypothetical protein
VGRALFFVAATFSVWFAASAFMYSTANASTALF